jgi:hypothetical protein
MGTGTAFRAGRDRRSPVSSYERGKAVSAPKGAKGEKDT